MGLNSKKISNDQELIESDPISCPQNQKGNNLIHKLTAVYDTKLDQLMSRLPDYLLNKFRNVLGHNVL